MQTNTQKLTALLYSHFEDGRIRLSELLALLEIFSVVGDVEEDTDDANADDASTDNASTEDADSKDASPRSSRGVFLLANVFQNDFPVLKEFVDSLNESSLSDGEEKFMKIVKKVLREDSALASKLMSEAKGLNYDLAKLSEKFPEFNKYLN